MKLQIPCTVSLKCPHCDYRFVTHAKLISNLRVMYCPKCGTKDSVFEFLTKDLRRRYYNRLRFLLERKYGDLFHDVYVKHAPEVSSDDRTAW